MKVLKKMLKIIGIIVAVILIVMIGLLALLKYLVDKPSSDKYFEKVETECELEEKYTGYGTYEISSYQQKSGKEAFSTYKIWYPKTMVEGNGKYPVVVMVNGTGVPYKKYEAMFKHLASWGFIVIGNDDANAWAGNSTSESLNFILELNEIKESIFYKKVDTEKIGISDHSQGGVGAINAVTNFDNSSMYKSIYTASCTQLPLANALKWDYDVTKVTIPYFMVAGAGTSDADMITPLSSLKEHFDILKDSSSLVMARRSNVDHGEMLIYADGYMTAWFCYTLLDDREAARVFEGETPEILHNKNWQDVDINLID